MNANVGGLDRALRITLGLGLVLASYFHKIGAWGWIGLIPIATGLFRFCPAYLPFKWNTCSKSKY
jgi:Protein of unknown function (DUF2892)